MANFYASLPKEWLLRPLLLQCIFVSEFVVQGFGQDTVFKETMGTATSATIEEHELYNYFSNVDLTMTGAGIGDPPVLSRQYQTYLHLPLLIMQKPRVLLMLRYWQKLNLK